MFRAICLAAALVFTLSAVDAQAVDIKDPENTLVIELKSGKVYIEMLPDVAPATVSQIKMLARQGAYDGVAFHRVIDGFMAQTGDVQYGNLDKKYNSSRVGTGGSSMPDLPAEFSSVPFVRGTAGMARSADPNSGNSQFFIMYDDGSFLNGQYTAWGHVISGMEAVDNIKRGGGSNGEVSNPDKMIKVYVAADQ